MSNDNITDPIYDSTVPIACTITTAEIAGRVEQIEQMRSHLRALVRTADGMVLHFDPSPDLESVVRQFMIDEQRCCKFWGFELVTEPKMSLRWDGPPDAADAIDRIAAYLEGREPLAHVLGIL